MSWWDVVTGVLVVALLFSMMAFWYFRGWLDGLNQARRIVDEVFDDGKKVQR